METRTSRNKRKHKRRRPIFLSVLLLALIISPLAYFFFPVSLTPQKPAEPSQDYDIQSFNENVIAYDEFLSTLSSKLKSFPLSKDSSYYKDLQNLLDQNSKLQAKLYAIKDPDALSSSALELSKKISTHSASIKRLITTGEPSGDQHEIAYEEYLFARQSYIDSLKDYITTIEDSYPDFATSLSAQSKALSSLPLSISEEILSLENAQKEKERKAQSKEIAEYAEIVNPIIIEIPRVLMEYIEELVFAIDNPDYVYSSSFLQMQWHLQQKYDEQRKMFHNITPPSSIDKYHKKVEDSLPYLDFLIFENSPDSDIQSKIDMLSDFADDFSKSTEELSIYINN